MTNTFVSVHDGFMQFIFKHEGAILCLGNFDPSNIKAAKTPH